MVDEETGGVVGVVPVRAGVEDSIRVVSRLVKFSVVISVITGRVVSVSIVLIFTSSSGENICWFIPDTFATISAILVTSPQRSGYQLIR